MEKELTLEQKKRVNIILGIQLAASSIGTILGVVYAHRRSKGFWGYVGYMLLGSLTLGTIAYLATMPAQIKLANDIESNK